MAPDLVLIEWVDSGQPIPGWQWLSDLDCAAHISAFRSGSSYRMTRHTKVLAPNLGASEGENRMGSGVGTDHNPDGRL